MNAETADQDEEATLRVTRSFCASAARLFEAWSDADQFCQWSWGSLANDTRADLDFRVGGKYRVSTERPDGVTWAFFGEYLEVEPNRRIVLTLNWTAPMGYESEREVLEVEFLPDGDSTQVTFLHRGVPTAEARKAHRDGWLDTLANLSQLLE